MFASSREVSLYYLELLVDVADVPLVEDCKEVFLEVPTPVIFREESEFPRVAVLVRVCRFLRLPEATSSEV